MIVRHPQGGSKLPEEEVVGRIVLADRGHHWEGYRPLGRIVGTQGRNFLVEPLARTWNAETHDWSYDGSFLDDRTLVDKRTLRMLCDTVDEAISFVRIEAEAAKSFKALLARTSDRIRETVEASAGASPAP